jgi:predicted ATP-grasp superfamily ATP-dependent carboligase
VHIPGVAMSATFLVREGRSRLIATGRQRMTLREGRFSYEGGVLPCACPEALAIASAAVASVEGLNGLVGVDFIHDPGPGRVTVLEINPRPTTSCVGLARILPPGLLADAWLAREFDEWSLLMDRVDAAIAAASPIGFDADGATCSVGVAVEVVRS